MVCKIFVPTCFEIIEEHLVGPKHVQNLQTIIGQCSPEDMWILLYFLSQCTLLFTCWVFIIGLNDEPSLYNHVWSLEELIHSWQNTWIIFHQMSSVYTFSRIRSQDNTTWKNMIFKLNCWVSKIWKIQQYALKKNVYNC